MASSWARTLTRWRPHQDGEVTYDLSHLHPMRYDLMLDASSSHAARAVEIRVGFSSHTFTVSCEQHEAHIHYSSLNDPRQFCSKRYELSKRLPEIVRNLKGRNCLFGRQENYLVVELPGVIPKGFEYWIFFDVRGFRTGPNLQPDGVLMFVQSAYIGDVRKPPYGPKPRKIGFNALVGLTLQGRKPQRP